MQASLARTGFDAYLRGAATKVPAVHPAELELASVQDLPQISGAIGVRGARQRTAILAVGVGAVAVVLGGALLLWAHYGTAVFFEMVAAGIAACF